LGRTTFRHIASERGIIAVKLAREGVKKEMGGRETRYRVRVVMVKWKKAKVDWLRRRVGEEKIALLVKTWGVR
jgi:hypothetical protein